MQIGRERPDEHGRVPPHRHDVEWDQCTGVGPSGGSSAPQGGWGHSGRHWWLPWAGSRGLGAPAGGGDHKEFGVGASLQWGCRALRGHGMLGPAVGPPPGRLPAPPACTWRREGAGFWVTLPSCSHASLVRAVPAVLALLLVSEGPAPRPPGCLWGSAELLGASELIAMLLRTCCMWQGRGRRCCAGGVRTRGSLPSRETAFLCQIRPFHPRSLCSGNVRPCLERGYSAAFPMR